MKLILTHDLFFAFVTVLLLICIYGYTCSFNNTSFTESRRARLPSTRKIQFIVYDGDISERRNTQSNVVDSHTHSYVASVCMNVCLFVVRLFSLDWCWCSVWWSISFNEFSLVSFFHNIYYINWGAFVLFLNAWASNVIYSRFYVRFGIGYID